MYNVTTTEVAHLAFCALVALHLANKNSSLNTPTAENIFLVRWLMEAQKQRRFSKNVANDIQWLLERGRHAGLTGQLKLHLEYIWFSCSGHPEKQSDLFRLSYAMETLKARGWEHRIINERKKIESRIKSHIIQKKRYHIQKDDLESCFATDGQQRKILFLRMTGDIVEFFEILKRYSLHAQIHTAFPTYNIVTLRTLVSPITNSDITNKNT